MANGGGNGCSPGLGRIKAKGVKQKVRRSMLTGHEEYNEDALHFSLLSASSPLPLIIRYRRFL